MTDEDPAPQGRSRALRGEQSRVRSLELGRLLLAQLATVSRARLSANKSTIHPDSPMDPPHGA